jgi:hypothetical protein
LICCDVQRNIERGSGKKREAVPTLLRRPVNGSCSIAHVSFCSGQSFFSFWSAHFEVLEVSADWTECEDLITVGFIVTRFFCRRCPQIEQISQMAKKRRWRVAVLWLIQTIDPDI